MNEKTDPSDLTDEEWEWIKELIPAAKNGGRPRTLCMRAVLNAIFYVTKGGIQWRMLPINFPKWQSVYHYLRAWKRQGVWVRIHATIPGGRYNPVNTEFSGLSFRKHLCNNTPLTETMCGLPVGGNHGACCTQRA